MPRHFPLPTFTPPTSVHASRNRCCFDCTCEKPWATHGKSSPSVILPCRTFPEPSRKIVLKVGKMSFNEGHIKTIIKG